MRPTVTAASYSDHLLAGMTPEPCVICKLATLWRCLHCGLPLCRLGSIGTGLHHRLHTSGCELLRASGTRHAV